MKNINRDVKGVNDLLRIAIFEELFDSIFSEVFDYLNKGGYKN